MATALQPVTRTAGVSRFTLPRIFSVLAGGLLVFYGMRKKNSLFGRLASTAGFSLIASSLGTSIGPESLNAPTLVRKLLA